MPIVSFSSPMVQETEENRSFRTHAAYQSAFRSLAFGGRMKSRHHHLPDFAHRALTAYGTKIRYRPTGIDLDTVRSCLHRAWGSEAILCATAELSPGADLTRLALAWGSVQTYYACYNVVQATLVAEGKPRSEHHNTTQNQAVDLWAVRSFSLEPWSLAATWVGAPNTCPTGFLNGPGRPLNTGLHAWTGLAQGEEWDLAGKALRSTRNDRVNDHLAKARELKKKQRIKTWREDEAQRLAHGKKPRSAGPPAALPHLTSAEKQTAQQHIRPFTMLDYLFRLRIKANYVDVDVFSQGPESDHAAEAFASGMQDLVTTTLLVHELRLGKLLGSRWVLDEADSWIASHAGASTASGLAGRRAILASA